MRLSNTQRKALQAMSGHGVLKWSIYSRTLVVYGTDGSLTCISGRTWLALQKRGYMDGSRITDAGRAALQEADDAGTRD